MRKSTSLLLALATLSTSLLADSEDLNQLESLENFALLDHEGKFHELDYYSRIPGVKGFLIFIQGNGCPLVQKRIPELKRLRDTYEGQGILFAMINANPQDERAEIEKEAEEFGIDIPILLDESQAVAEMLGAKRTAEAFLYDAKSKKIVYRGAIDDRFSYQKEKPQASKHYLKNAVDSFLEGKPIETSITEAPGCKITLTSYKEELSYVKDIAPILKSRCVSCHTKGGLGPFPMSNFKKVKGWSEMMAEVVLTKQMPPWHADPHIGEFENDESITPEEVHKLVSWVKSGSPRGEGEDPLASYTPTLPTWTLGEPTKVVTLPEQKVAAEGVFDYRYVTLDNPFDEDVWLTATEVNPGNTRVLHHVIVTARHPEVKQFEKWITGYAPGSGAYKYPEGSAVRLPKGWNLRFQLHYTASGKEEQDVTRLGLHFMKEKQEKEFKTQIVMNRRFKIPPGEREHPEEKQFKMRKPSTLYAINPHMHYRGKRMSFQAEYPDGRIEPLLSVPNYNFNWQRTYILKEPLKIPAGTTIKVANAWDNSALNPHNPDPKKSVRWGDQSFEEMFFATLNYIED